MQDMLFLTILILTFLLVELIVMIVFLKFYFSEHKYTYNRVHKYFIENLAASDIIVELFQKQRE